MLERLRHLACLALLALAPLPAAAAGSPSYERVSIGSAGDEQRLDGVLFRPAGRGPFPAVVALHGCGGLWRQDGDLSARHADWAQILTAAGYAVLLPDSYGSRGLGSQCGVRDISVRASRERVGDAASARRWLQGQPGIKPDAISLLGWSGGGATVLAAIRKDRRPADGKPDFARAIAFYPGCRTQLESRDFAARLPALILIGEADDWTPPTPCDLLAKAARTRGEPVELVLYPGAVHDFDHPRLALKQRKDIAFSATGTGSATVGTHPEAREDAIRRVRAFLGAP